MTPEELGFNARFHSLENEFDAIGAQFNNLGQCTAELRADLIGVVHELEAKITALQNSVHESLPPPDRGSDIFTPVKVGETTGILTKIGDDFQIIKYEPVPMPGPLVDPPDKVTIPNKGGVFVPKEVEPPVVLEVVKGLQKTLDGTQLFTEGKGVTVGDLRTLAPGATLPGGQALGSVIATMPAETTFTDTNDAVAKITDHIVGQLSKTESKSVRKEVVNQPNRTGTALTNSGVTVLGVEDNVAAALGDAGLGTVGKLSGASTTEIATALTGAGLDAGLADDLFAKATLTKALRNG
jgi:hypothetical protein